MSTQVLTLALLLLSSIVFCWLAEELYWEGKDDACAGARFGHRVLGLAPRSGFGEETHTRRVT